MIGAVCWNTADSSLITGNPVALLGPSSLQIRSSLTPASSFVIGQRRFDNGPVLGRQPQPPTVSNLCLWHLLLSAASNTSRYKGKCMLAMQVQTSGVYQGISLSPRTSPCNPNYGFGERQSVRRRTVREAQSQEKLLNLINTVELL